jgi:hypothetical protein
MANGVPARYIPYNQTIGDWNEQNAPTKTRVTKANMRKQDLFAGKKKLGQIDLQKANCNTLCLIQNSQK